MAPDDDKTYRTGDPLEEYSYRDELLEEKDIPETPPRENMNIKHKQPKWMKGRR